MAVHRVGNTALCLALAAAAGTAAPQQAYELTDLGTLGGSTASGAGINAIGQVVGSSTTIGDAATHAFLYSQGVMTDLGTLGGTTSGAAGINASGQIVGASTLASGMTHAALWSGGSVTDLDSGDTTYSSTASAINDAGYIVGTWDSTAAIFGYGAPAALQSVLNFYSSASAVNSSSLVVGTSGGAVYWAADMPTVLVSPFAYNVASGVNDSNVVVGTTNGTLPIAEVWNVFPDSGTPTTTQLLNGALAGEPSGSYFGAAAYGINNTGQIVGAIGFALGTLGGRAVLWPSAAAEAVDLNTTLRPQAAGSTTLSSAVAINVNGLIVANGTLTGTGAAHAYLLMPVTAAGPPVATLSATPATERPGQSFALTWSSTNAWACTAGGSGPNGAPWSGLVGTSGTQTIQTGSTAGTVTATLSCSFGNQQSSPVQAVVMITNPPLTVALNASPTSVTSGHAITLTWTSANATACSASGGGANDGWSGTSRAISGNAAITEIGAAASPLTLTFTLTCTNSGTGQSTRASVKVTLNPPASSGGGGGALDPWSLLGLVTIGLMGRRHKALAWVSFCGKSRSRHCGEARPR